MKHVIYPLDNAGGLIDIYAIPPTAVISIDHISAGRFLSLASTEEVIHIECTPDGGFTEERKLDESGYHYEISISGFIPGRDDDNLVKELCQGVWTVATRDAEGILILSGAHDSRLLFEVTRTTGQSRENRKGFSFKFKCTDQFPSIRLCNDPF
jgi:hypothetical protein